MDMKSGLINLENTIYLIQSREHQGVLVKACKWSGW